MGQTQLNELLKRNNAGRTFAPVEGSRWGELILPAPDEHRVRTDEGLKIVVLAAYNIGLSLLKGLLAYEKNWPGKIELLAVSTDDAVEDTAKISMRKRLWRFYSPEEKLIHTANLAETALKSGLPVYTGELKIDWFRKRLAEWAPDLIIVTGCGQVLDQDLLSIPKLGTINFHPADLPAGHGAGAQPFQDLVDRADPWTRWTVHEMTPEIDAGPVIGVSCPVFVGDANGQVKLVGNKILERLTLLLPPMVSILLDEIASRDHAIGQIDFEARLPAELKNGMQLPLE